MTEPHAKSAQSMLLCTAPVWIAWLMVVTMTRDVAALSLAMQRLALLDRDGVINQDVGAPGVIDASALVLTPNAGKAIGRLRRAGWNVAMVTNQSCVGKGIITEDELRIIQQTVQRMLLQDDEDGVIDKIYQCTSTKQDPRMKPQPGMVLEALADFGAPDTCCFIGDTSTDLQAAKAGGVELRILVSTGYGRSLMGDAPSSPAWIGGDSQANSMHESTFPFLYCRDLSQAVDWLLQQPS